MSDSPPKAASGQGPTEATKDSASAASDPLDKVATAASDSPGKAASSASGALDDAAKAMDAAVVKSEPSAPAADAVAKDSATEAKPAPATTANAEASKTDLSKIDPPKPVVDLMQLSATNSGMHQQYVAPGVARQSLFSSTKYQAFFFAGMVLISLLFFLKGGLMSDFGVGDKPSSMTGGGTLTNNDVLGPNGDLNPNHNVRPPPVPQADFTVNANTIGDTTSPIPRMHADGGTQNKGGYAEETADLEAAEAMVDKDPVKALQMVDQHDTDYPRGMLDPEARVIRIEAYAKKGEDAKALGLGNEFLDDYPHSPRAGRVVAVVEALKNKLDSGAKP